ncbi:MAG: FAD-binding oxidoreductase [Acidimicrobiia bacterium]
MARNRSKDVTEAAQVVIVGAGIAGVSTAFHLVRLGVTDIAIADPLPPLSLTSDKSTECYRDWWPTLPMFRLMSRSIDLLERYTHESSDRFTLSRRGYLYATADRSTLGAMVADAERIAATASMPLRYHARQPYGYRPADLDRWDHNPSGADVFLDGAGLRRAFPFLASDVAGGVHVRRAGWLSAQQLGAWMIEQIIDAGVVFIRGAVTGATVESGRVRSITVDEQVEVSTATVVNAAGPLAGEVGAHLGVEVPVSSEIHQKVSFDDHRGGIAREAPMVIWHDPQQIGWSDEERSLLTASGRADTTGVLPPFVHGRPEGGDQSRWALGLWAWHEAVTNRPRWPIDEDPLYPELVLRGLGTMLPAMRAYEEGLPHHTVDGGYYTKTIDNAPLIGPVGPTGSYVCTALSGYGIMASCGAGELAALHITNGPLPDYADAFRVERLSDPAYRAQAAVLRSLGQI